VQALETLRQDNAQRRKAQSALEFVNRRLKVLSNRMLDIQEEERRRISRELHDDVGQSLLALNIGLHRLQGPVQGEGARILEQCIGVAESIHGKVRELSVELRPPHLEQLGLADALRWLANRQSEITGVGIRVRCSGPRALGLAPEIETACYRICQEALNNATRHARAQAITVELAADAARLTLAIRDDGVGFDRNAKRELAAGGMGLITMEERAELAGGRFEIATEVDAGTCVKVVFPLVAGAAQASA
jgi:signal transduction histidine kinase